MKINLEPKISNVNINMGDIIITDECVYMKTDGLRLVDLKSGCTYSHKEYDTCTELIEQRFAEIILEVIPRDAVVISRE